jgi:hypothetical protein
MKTELVVPSYYSQRATLCRTNSIQTTYSEETSIFLQAASIHQHIHMQTHTHQVNDTVNSILWPICLYLIRFSTARRVE